MIPLEYMNINYMKNKLWVFGDSFTAEYYENNNYKNYVEYKKGVAPIIWSNLLSKKINLEVINHAKCGASNYTIFNQLIKSIDDINENDIVIIGWSYITRYISGDPNTRTLIEGPIGPFSKITCDEIFFNRNLTCWGDEVSSWIKLINRYSNLKSINIFHWSADERVFNSDIDILDKKFIVTNEDLSIYNYFNQKNIKFTIKQETNNLIDDLHCSQIGHNLMCDFIYNKII